MSEAGSQWWPPEAESENGRSSGAAQVRRPNPILTPDQRQPTPDVAAVLAKTARLGGGKPDVVRINVRLPADLVGQIKGEAYAWTHHRRRGFQDLVEMFLRYGLEAYQTGGLKVELAERVEKTRIVRKKE